METQRIAIEVQAWWPFGWMKKNLSFCLNVKIRISKAQYAA